MVFGGVGGSITYLPMADAFALGGYEIGGKDYTTPDGGAYQLRRPRCERRRVSAIPRS